MDLIIGGAYQGKLTLAAREYGLTPGDICDLAAGEPVLGARCYIHLEELTRRQEDTESYLPLLTAAEVVIAREIGRTVSPGGITTAVGMISLANAAGRVVLGGLFDRWGRSRTMQLVGGIFLLTGLVLIGALKLGSFPLLIAGFLLGGMAYGGVTPANAAFVSSYYGMRHYAVNLSVVVTNLLFASFGSTIAGALYDATGSYLSTDAMILVLAVLSAAVSFGIDLCDRRMLKRR